MHRSFRVAGVTAMFAVLVGSNVARAEDASSAPAPAAPAPAAPTAEATSAPAAPSAEVTVEAPRDPAAPSAAQKGDYNVKLRDIEERVNQLKEKIFQSKARLIQLQEVVLHGTIAGAKAVLVHKNEMGSSFKLMRVQYALDGAPIFNRADTGGSELEQEAEIEIFNGSIAPGNHQISVYLEYQGYGYGVFSYLKGYRFKVKSSQTFTAEEGKLTTIKIVGYEKGGITTELQERPAVRYDVETTKELRAEKAEADAPAPTPQKP